VLVPDAPHAFWNYDPWFDGVMDRAARFIVEYATAKEVR